VEKEMAYNVRVLGVGGLMANWPHLDTNYVIGKDGKYLLIDCGTTIKTALQMQQISPASIDAIYISHLHPDHVGGLPWLAFEMAYKYQKRPQLFVPKAIREMLWDGFLCASLEAGGKNGALTLNDFFSVWSDYDGTSFLWNGAWFTTQRVPHVVGYTQEASMFSRAVLMQTREECSSVLFSTDIADACTDLLRWCDSADVVIYDCDFVGTSGVHPSYRFLCGLPEEYRRKMWLTHYARGDVGEVFPDVSKDGFMGLLQPGQVLSVE
jgi:hypothetical protein